MVVDLFSRVSSEEEKLATVCQHLARLELLLTSAVTSGAGFRMNHPVWVCE